jgi:L-fuconolactonase
MRIDAHLHFWQPARGFDNRPVADNAAYRRDFMPADVLPDLDACGIDGAILVQTAPQIAETDWMLGVARGEPRIFGVTAWVDLAAAPVDFAPLLAEPKVVGIRAQLRRIDDDAFVARPVVVENLAAALRAGLNVTILAEQRHYRHVEKTLAQLPPGPLTINHLALRFPSVDHDAWRQAMRAFAQRPDTYVQLSGLPFLFQSDWRGADARAVLDEAFSICGAERLVFASDYPMLLRFATYREWVGAVERFLADRRLPDAARDAIFAGNARRANPRLRVPRSLAASAHGAGAFTRPNLES